MFKLLAIRPLEGCASHIQKCLKTGMMYYFCNDYIIEPGSHIRRRSKNIKPLKEDFFTVVSESDYFEDNSSERKSPTVSVSAIVGMNGDGKSTLVELMMRLINNCAISYELCASSDNSKGENGNKTEPHYNLRRVENAKAELYYIIDNVVYRMAEEKGQKETRIWKVSELNPFNEKGEELMRWEIDSVEIQKVEDDPKGFFFTIVSNYSHYAYNIYDYEKEWEIRGGEKNDDEKCWLHYIFHKNDDYLTPITLHPLRNKGDIDINNEKWLSKQRLLSLFLDADNPSKNPLSFRRVNGKDANVLKLIEETKSKLQQKAIIDFFNAATDQGNRYKMLFDEINKVDEEVDGENMYYASDVRFVQKYITLAEKTLPSHFIDPIEQIINQEGFSDFASSIVGGLYAADTNIAKNAGNIWSVIVLYNTLNNKINQYIDIITYSKIAWVYLSKGYYKKAVNRYKKVVKKSELELGEDHPLTAMTYCNLALSYKIKGGHDELALKYFEMAVAILEKMMDKIPSLSATTYNNLALVYRFKGDYEKALMYFKKTLEIQEKKLEEKDPFIIKTYNNLGGVYEAMKDYSVALSYYYRVLKIKESYLRVENTDVAKSYCDIARVYKNMSDYVKALDYYNRALDIQKSELGKDHPNTVETISNIYFVYRAKGDFTKALDYYKESNLMQLMQKTHYESIYNLDDENIGMVLMELENYDKNEEEFDEVIQKEIELIQKNEKANQDEKELIQEEKNRIWYKRRDIGKVLSKRKSLFNTDCTFLQHLNILQLGRLDTLYRIMKSCGIDWKIVTKKYSDLSLEEKCQHYVVYKIWSILSTNPQHQKAYQKDDIESIRECGTALEDCIEEIKNDDQSHITQKLRQVESFINEGLHDGGMYERIGKKESGCILVKIDNLKEYYGEKALSLDNLPPPIYNWNVLFNIKEDPARCDIELDTFSSGEKQKLNSVGAIIYHLQNLAHTASEIKYNNVNLIMEEIELYYHPEYQRQYFNQLLDLIKRANLKNIQNINIVFVTHSPFILSDIPKCNVLFLKEGMPKDIMQENTFGANIHTLLKNGFFMPNLPIGEFAYRKINALFNKLNTGDINNDDEEKRKKDLNDIYQHILLVGEPFLRNQLLLLYNSFKGSR